MTTVKKYVLTTVAPRLVSIDPPVIGTGKFFLVSVRKTKSGRSTAWHFDPKHAKTWTTRRGVEEYQFCHRYLKARIGVIMVAA